jgi:hypothetical protein
VARAGVHVLLGTGLDQTAGHAEILSVASAQGVNAGDGQGRANNRIRRVT